MDSVFWAAIAFVIGLVVGVLATVAAFKAAVAVLGTRTDELFRRQENTDKEVERFRETLANILLNATGSKRWNDPGHDRG